MLLVTNSYWFRISYLSKLCFIIICEERTQKVLILTSSEKFIIFLANIRHVCFKMVNSKHRYCRCLLIFFGLVKMTFGLVDASYSLPKGQAVKLTFFAPCFDNTAIYFKTFWQPCSCQNNRETPHFFAWKVEVIWFYHIFKLTPGPKG